MIKAVGLDHLVLNVADVERSLAWYHSELGLEEVRVEEWRRGEAPFPSLRIDATTIIDLVPTRSRSQAPAPVPAVGAAPASAAADRTGQNVDHVCLVIEPTDLAAVVESGRLNVVEGPSRRFGARGEGQSIYVYDPDDNLVELRHYG